ncbi:hypothetical protein Ancab_034685 [Ancistrocladus abbreviatus]
MGKWNRRNYVRRPKHYDYQWSPPRETLRDPETVVWQDNVPLWEKKFCYLIGRISWEKILGAKKFLHCHSNILGWDDSASEEAFHNAKQRFWAKINGLQCDIQLPDPDMYIDDIDWNPHIDPELIEDLDQEYFVPDENGNDVRIDDMMHEGTLRSGSVHDEKQDDEDNPWERSNDVTSSASRDKAMGWNQWCNSVDVMRTSTNEDNPWECHHKQDNGAVNDNQCVGTWGKASSWKPQSRTDLPNKFSAGANPWKPGGAVTEYGQSKGWQNAGDSSWGWKGMESANTKSIYPYSSYPGRNNYGATRGAPNSRSSSWGQKRQDNYNGEQNVSVKRTGGREEFHGISRKREGSYQYGECKGPRLQGVNYQTAGQWRNGSNNKRVSFAMQY